jgi:septal ring factor EnvC (AmiA/AmiB activator)
MDFKKYLDIKTIFILVLATALILSFIFRPSKKIDNHQTERELIEKENKRLRNSFDSLSNVNKEIDKYRKLIADSLNEVAIELSKSKDKIKNLEKRRNENNNTVRNLNANGVADEFSKYLEGK